MTAPILLNIDNKIATITLNRPEVMNAINEEMLPLWVDALEQCNGNKARAAALLGLSRQGLHNKLARYRI